jgi:MinD superfamily P-loop ATPase
LSTFLVTMGTVVAGAAIIAAAHNHRHHHHASYLAIDPLRCQGCGSCLRGCKHGALKAGPGRTFTIDPELCEGCGHCAERCRFQAIYQQCRAA